jgi:hypothetical protein
MVRALSLAEIDLVRGLEALLRVLETRCTFPKDPAHGRAEDVADLEATRYLPPDALYALR